MYAELDDLGSNSQPRPLNSTYRLTLAGQDQAKRERVAEQLAQLGHPVEVHAVDRADEGRANRMAAQAETFLTSSFWAILAWVRWFISSFCAWLRGWR